MSRTARIVSRLVDAALQSNMNFMHAACIVKGGKIFSISTNNCREFINGHRVGSTHAEIASIKNANKDTLISRQHDMWVIRITLHQGEIKLCSSKPCRSCIAALKKYGITRIFYSTEQGEIKCEKIKEMSDEYITSFQKRKWGLITNWFL